ncbi:hypothetical protein LOCC1_G003065 [Lachnellula occidentalis]|uniref:MARVEL domain-containing protein n=1 Tax=Lachnellula occidentalis TaxID=215460 RepID=A0A8H8S668_9HELO|nr:hypothetical protein LOCC1_G003065 [Lachnellula occidentalis]
MAIMEFGVQHLQMGKLGLHIAQAVFVFVAWVLDITVFQSSAKIDGRVGWNFGVWVSQCFLTIPAIIYLTMVPRFPRTRKLANPYAMAAVDCLFCVIWLSAFATVANWNGSGKCGDGCGKAKGVVGLGVFTWLLWIATSMISLYGVVYYKREGYLPGASRAPTDAAMIDPDKEAFSAGAHDGHDDEYAPVHEEQDMLHDADRLDASSSHYGDEPYGGGGSAYGAGSGSGSAYGGGGYVPPTAHDEPTGYGGAGMMHNEPTGYGGAHEGAGMMYNEPAEYGGAVALHDGRVQFPSARYDNV